MKSSQTYFLTTERLCFRIWNKSDFDLSLKLWGDYKVTKLIDSRGKLSNEQVLEKLNKEIENEREFGVQYFPIFLLENEEFIGCCGLRPYNLQKKVYEIGFHICSQFWRKGYAFEASEAMIKFAFYALKAKGLFAGHNPQNEPSKHLLKKLGFQYTHDEFYPPTGLNHPSYFLTKRRT